MDGEGNSENVLLKVNSTDKIRESIMEAILLPDVPKNLQEQLIIHKDKDKVPISLLRSLIKYYKSTERQVYLHELLRGSDVILPKYVEPRRNTDLEERIQRLKNEQMNKEYRKMTRNVSRGCNESDMKSFGDEVKSVQKMLITILNFLLTVVGSFMFVYKATEYAMHEPDVAIQTCAGLTVGTLVFFADLYFVMKHELVEEGSLDQSVYDKKD